jgi:UDP-glucose 4-epimerase
LITGATGFLGHAVCLELVRRGYSVRAMVRRGTCLNVRGAEPVQYYGLSDQRSLQATLEGCAAVIHLAGRVHRMGESSRRLLGLYHESNTEATRHLALMAADAGIRHLLFAGTVKSVGESNTRAWTEDDIPSPLEPYGVSKLEAERALAAVTAKRGMATTVLRLPLMYGPGMKANMLRLFELVDRGTILPLAGIRNQRSLLYVRNAAAAFCSLLGPADGHNVFFAADNEDLSTPELISRIGAALGRRARLLPAPRRTLEFLARARVPRLSPLARRMVGSLTVDAGRLRARIGALPFSVDAGLRETADWYHSTRATQ